MKIGLRRPVYAPVESDADGVPVYGAPVVMGAMLDADIVYDRRVEYLYADNRIEETMEIMEGGTVTVALDDLTAEAAKAIRETLLGGLGYIRVDKAGTWEAAWIHKAAFAVDEVHASTKGEAIQWQRAMVRGEMVPVYTDDDEPVFEETASFDSEAAAIAWIDNKAANA